MSVPMVDLRAQYAPILPEIHAAVARVFETCQFRGGPEVERFESAVSALTGVRHAIGAASGTDALWLAVRALNPQPGDEIITTAFSFFATAGAIVNAGAVPVFADIDPETFNIDPVSAAQLITPRTRAILPVHLYGQCADMDPLQDLARQYGLAIIEDCAQALGATYRGQQAGSMGDLAALSFYPTKNLGAAGEGGMVLTNNDALAARVRKLRCHGGSAQYVHEMVGTNSHLHAIQAAVLHVKLRYLPAWNAARREKARRYDALLSGLEGIRLPVVRPDREHVFHQYVIRIRRRDEAVQLLRARQIGCGVFYPTPLHRQQCFAPWAEGTSCPHAEAAAREVLALPIYPEITDAQQQEVADALRDHLRQG